MASVRAWKEGTPGEPAFSTDFEVVRKAVLQNTDIRTNRNKYYALELHRASTPGSSPLPYRVFTHYGRTDDLERSADAGVRESRYAATLAEAEAAYQQLYKQKTAANKGYKEIALASTRIGSARARGTSSGTVDAKTLQKIAGAPKQPSPSALPAPVQDLVRTLYTEATHTLTSTLQARITAQGIETPLGVLTLGQVEEGQRILDEAYAVFQKQQLLARAPGVLQKLHGAVFGRGNKTYHEQLVSLSGRFYTAIPHRLGRQRKAVEAAVLQSLAAFEEKQETLQLMRDMLQVSGEGASVLFEPEVDRQYGALRCTIRPLDKGEDEHQRMKRLVEGSQIKTKGIKVRSIYAISRAGERADFDKAVGNERLLLHGSRIQNWVGILSRGILLPKTVVSLGGSRTDGGWLGHGIYFGDAACTSYAYTSPSRAGSRYLAVARVALGKIKPYRQITHGLAAPPAGYDSCHGVRGSQFADDEYVVYRTAQQQLEYLVEVR